MKTALLLKNIQQYVALDEVEIQYLDSLLITKTFKQGEVIARRNEPARYMMYATEGYLMTFYTDEEESDHVVQFAGPGWWSGDLYSLAENVPTIYTTQALSDGEVLLLPKVAQEHLLAKYMKFERYFRIIFQNSLMRMQQRIIEHYTVPAKDRYLAFIKKFPNLEQHVPQKYIASYLGITPEFLSKIRRTLVPK